MEDGRCKLGLQGRLELVMLIEHGSTLRAGRGRLSVAPATAHRWWHRWQAASVSRARVAGVPAHALDAAAVVSVGAEQRGRAGDPHRAREDELRADAAAVPLTGRHRSTIWKVLKRHGVSRQRRTERPQTTRRYEWTEAGALLHIDAFELPKFDRPGPLGARRPLRAAPHPPRGQGQGRSASSTTTPAWSTARSTRRERAHRLGHPRARRRVDAPSRAAARCRR